MSDDRTALENRALEFTGFIMTYITGDMNHSPEKVKAVTAHVISVLKHQEAETIESCAELAKIKAYGSILKLIQDDMKN